MSVRIRTKELRHVRAGDLVGDERNWRVHPPYQHEALRMMLDKIGFAGAILAREDEGQLVVIDGHMRTEDTDPEEMLPVLILDLDEEEAGLLLATYDPIGAMAEAEKEALDQLLESVGDPDLVSLFTLIEGTLNVHAPEEDADEDGSDPEPDPPSGNDGSGYGGGTGSDGTEFVVITFRLSNDEYEEKATDIAEMITAIGVTPHIQRIR